MNVWGDPFAQAMRRIKHRHAGALCIRNKALEGGDADSNARRTFVRRGMCMFVSPWHCAPLSYVVLRASR